MIDSFNVNLVFDNLKPVVNLICESDFTKEIRIALQQGVEMKEHKTPFPIVVHLLSGEVEFKIDEDVKTLTEGSIISLGGGIPHSLRASKDSVVRLSLVKIDSVNRVKNVNNK